jgi:hypothetical protein
MKVNYKALLAGVVVLAAGSALAATISTAGLSDYLAGFNANGVQIKFSAAPVGVPEGGLNLFIVDDGFGNPAKAGQAYVLYEPTPPGSALVISDIVSVKQTFANGQPTGLWGIAYVSDNGTPLSLTDPGLLAAFGVTAFTVVGSATEDRNLGATIDVTPLVNQANYSGATAQFFSDGDSVPDGGATVALLGLALAGVEGLRRRVSK